MQQIWDGQSKLHSSNKATATNYTQKHMLFYNSNGVPFKVNKGDFGLQYLYIVPGKIPITHLTYEDPSLLSIMFSLYKQLPAAIPGFVN